MLISLISENFVPANRKPWPMKSEAGVSKAPCWYAAIYIRTWRSINFGAYICSELSGMYRESTERAVQFQQFSFWSCLYSGFTDARGRP